MDQIEVLDAALLWQDAERAMLDAQAEFDRVVYLYLVRCGPAPTAAMVEELASKRRDAFRVLLRVHDAITRCRCGMRIL